MEIHILGAGLAGCEAALFLARQGLTVQLYEQKPRKFSPAHKNENFAELVCSNSLKADRLASASGLLKAEMRLLGSSLLPVAEACRVAAGGALAVDRTRFAALVTRRVHEEPRITVHTGEVTRIDDDAPDTLTLVATGPLTEGALAAELARLTGGAQLAFYDAAAPIVTADSLDKSKIFAASRYGRGTADYWNCPFDKAGYEAFYEALRSAERAPLHAFDTPAAPDEPAGALAQNTAAPTVYEGCMPIEVMAQRGADTMRYGPLRPVGLTDPRTGHRPWANVQLRAENAEGTLYNLVGFQTNLKFGEQKRVFSMIPGLADAEFVRYGVMHRNTFLCSPALLTPELALQQHPNVFFAGQITGFEGYMESAACGLLAARAIAARVRGEAPPAYPADTMCGALLRYILTPTKDFQPMGANMGLLPPCETRLRDKRERYLVQARRAVRSMAEALGVPVPAEALEEAPGETLKAASNQPGDNAAGEANATVQPEAAQARSNAAQQANFASRPEDGAVR